MEYVASTIERLMQKPGDRAYVISTYVIGKEKILLEVSLGARLSCQLATNCAAAWRQLHTRRRVAASLRWLCRDCVLNE